MFSQESNLELVISVTRKDTGIVDTYTLICIQDQEQQTILENLNGRNTLNNLS